MKESTATVLVAALLTLAGAISLMIVAPARSNLVACNPQAAAQACR